MTPSFAEAYTLLIDAVVRQRPQAGRSGRTGVYDSAAGVAIAAAVYRVMTGLFAAVERLLDRPRYRSAAFADRMARPVGRGV